MPCILGYVPLIVLIILCIIGSCTFYVLQEKHGRGIIAQYGSLEAYITVMSKDGEWGDNICLDVAAQVFSMKILALIFNTKTNGVNKHVFHPEKADELLEVFIGNIDQRHFLALMLKGIYH